MRHLYQAEQWLPYDVETVFDFFADPANLPRLMPAWQMARIDEAALAAPPPRPGAASSKASGPAKIAAGQGTRMTISFRPVPLLPIRMPWDAEITEFVWNDHFCDIQLRRGPFAYWKHCHRLESDFRGGQPGTKVRDQIEYELPLGLLGDIADLLFVKRQMVYIFRYRQQRTVELLRAEDSRR